MKDISYEFLDYISGSGPKRKQERDYQTSNRGSGSQANHFGKPGYEGGISGGCTGGARPSPSNSIGSSSNYEN